MKAPAPIFIISLQWLAAIVTAAPSALQVPFLTNTSVGPDGPWNVIQNPVDSPNQDLYFFPSLTTTSALIPKVACQNQSSACPLPLPPLYEQSGAQDTLAANDSAEFDAATWDNISLTLDLVGSGHYIMDRITIDGNNIDGSGWMLADNFTIAFPGGSYYTQDVGLISLNASGDGTLAWTTTSGIQHTANKTLPAVYASGVIPSISYGLHVGSAVHNITGSLYLGGYDSSRIIAPPLNLTAGSTLELMNVYLNISSGGNAYTNLTESDLPLQVLPQQSTSPVVRFEPGAPYMYLSRSVCDAIAAHLPVTYSPEFNLYIWNTTSASTEKILSSPHFLLFTFTSSTGGSVSISLPFALLNLTLISPLVSSPTMYFPCSPFSPPDGMTYILGRAFLQGAFLGQNWQNDTLWLAQAPGPNTPSENVKTIEPGDWLIDGMVNPPSWEETWNGVLAPLPESENEGERSGLSSGAKAGIGVAVTVVGIAIVAAGVYCCRRRRAQGWVGRGRKGRVPELDNTANERFELGSGMRVEKSGGWKDGSPRDLLPQTRMHVVHQGSPVELEGG